MALPLRTAVLIVGAGPCGMAAALSLQQHGIPDVVIVDSIMGGENASRAMAIQAATLEALDTIGCVDKLLTLGEQVDGVALHDGKSYILSADFSLLSPYTKYPYGLLLPQWNTEKVMLEKLESVGIRVLRPFKAASMKPSQAEDYTIDVSFESGEVVQTKYVIGADGARSVIRQEAGISFSDPEGDDDADYGNLGHMVLGDVVFSSPIIFPPPAKKMFATISDGNFALLLPFPASVSPDKDRTVYRFVCGVPIADGPEAAAHTPSVEYLQSLFDRYALPSLSFDAAVGPQPIRIEQVYWSSRFRTHAAIADRCFTRLGNDPRGGVVVLIGDAAHVHSPVGGQGMSLGIRDAISLGPALKAYIDSSSQPAVSDKPLADWAAFRHARALAVIALTKQALGIISFAGKPGSWAWRPIRWLAIAFLRFITSFAFFNRRSAYRISGLAEI